jgi:hypothetical protein
VHKTFKGYHPVLQREASILPGAVADLVHHRVAEHPDRVAVVGDPDPEAVAGADNKYSFILIQRPGYFPGLFLFRQSGNPLPLTEVFVPFKHIDS